MAELLLPGLPWGQYHLCTQDPFFFAIEIAQNQEGYTKAFSISVQFKGEKRADSKKEEAEKEFIVEEKEEGVSRKEK